MLACAVSFWIVLCTSLRHGFLIPQYRALSGRDFSRIFDYFRLDYSGGIIANIPAGC